MKKQQQHDLHITTTVPQNIIKPIRKKDMLYVYYAIMLDRWEKIQINKRKIKYIYIFN